MQKHRELTLNRLKRFASDAQLGGKIYPQRAPVKLSTYAAQDRIRFHEAVQSSYRPLNLGERFTPIWSTHWVRVEIDIPKEWKNHEVHLLWDSTSEAMVWTPDGHPMQGLTGSGSGWASGSVRPEYCLVKHAHGGKKNAKDHHTFH